AADRMLQRRSSVSLTGPAEFAEIYMDPWSARWCDDSDNTVRWNTSVVPDGDYFLVAELSDGRTITTEVSRYQVQVRNGGALMAN
ncbi:MAG TPA: hypothetical protein VFU47_05080, partial [Armatimonadota bacterium]|nr:hypothetical protein [Armatimonadota bacterium]